MMEDDDMVGNILGTVTMLFILVWMFLGTIVAITAIFAVIVALWRYVF